MDRPNKYIWKYTLWKNYAPKLQHPLYDVLIHATGKYKKAQESAKESTKETIAR